MKIQKPKALTLKSTADLRAIILGNKPLSVEDAQDIASYAIQCELENIQPFHSIGLSEDFSYYPEHQTEIA